MDGGAWWATVHGVAKSRTRLSDFTFTLTVTLWGWWCPSFIPAQAILEQGLIAGMNIIGEQFRNNEVFVPEVLIAARAMNQGAQLLKPLLLEEGVQASGKVCIGTVQGDLHDIGKNLVKMMLEGKGLEVIDLGTDVAPPIFVFECLRCPFYYRGLECKSRKSRNTGSNRQIWPWNTE